MWRALVLLLVLISLFCCVLSDKHVPSWNGEWGVHVAQGVNTDFLTNLGFTVVKRIGNLPDAYVVRHSEITTQHPPHQIEAAHASLQSHEHVIFTDKLYKKRMTNRGYVPADPLYPNQWHLNNTGQLRGTPGQDINVTAVWNMGYSGQGVRIAIVDDGYQYAHPDLAPGYRPDSSYNLVDGTPDPAPGQFDAHGTAAAGVALAANNSMCGVGAAFGAAGSGIRLLAQGGFTDVETAAALHFRNDVNDIYSNSWGPSDDGGTVDGPGYFARAALEDGIVNGRGGLGSIFVWAAGNGLQSNDNCNYDGFANHRATIAVGAVGNDGKQSYYSEPCSAMLITAPSNSVQAGITTTDLLGLDGYDDGNCTDSFGGTSSACPLVAGVIALLLEVNPKLTWRDVQFILLSTADKNDASDPDWTVNGAGYHINHKYGFGRVNAFAAVRAAQHYENLISYKSATYSNVIVNQTIPDNDTYTGVNKSVHVSSDLIVEHVEVTVSIPNFFSAGDLKVVLTSPSGTQSVLAEQHGNGYDMFVTFPGYPYAAFCAPAPFGPQIPVTETVSGQVAIPNPASACTSNITNCADLQGKIVLVEFSLACHDMDQVYNVQQCGAILVAVANRFVGPPTSLSEDDPSVIITVPAVTIPLDVAIVIQGELEEKGNLSVTFSQEYYQYNISFDGWTFATVRNWGESAHGEWNLQVFDSLQGAEAHFASYNLTIYGHSKPFKLPYFVVGIIVAALVAIIFIVATILYVKNRSRASGYVQVH